MKQKHLYMLWAAAFVMTGILGCLSEAEGLLKWLKTLLGVLFFLPPALLLHRAFNTADKKTVLRVRGIAVCSLCATLLLLVLNIAAAPRSETVGTFLHYLLVFVSAPMICCGYWVLSLFLWACLLTASLQKQKK